MVQWEIVPRGIHVSYSVHRAGRSHGMLEKAAAQLSRVIDPKVPVVWLGDIAFVTAHPQQVEW